MCSRVEREIHEIDSGVYRVGYLNGNIVCGLIEGGVYSGDVTVEEKKNYFNCWEHDETERQREKPYSTVLSDVLF